MVQSPGSRVQSSKALSELAERAQQSEAQLVMSRASAAKRGLANGAKFAYLLKKKLR